MFPIAGEEARLRSFAVEGTVFWLVVVAVVEITVSTTPAKYSAPTTPSQYAVAGIILGVLSLVMAYFCWTNRKFSFLAAVALALITAVGAYPYPQPFRTVDTPFGAEVDSLVILGSLLVALFGIRAYREASHQDESKPTQPPSRLSE
jgi:uncharacterized membrane protein